MKHPSSIVLQKFVDKELNSFHETLLKEHLVNCALCSQVIHEMKELSIGIKKEKKMSLPMSKRNELFHSAKLALKKNREKIEKRENLKDFFKELIELRVPAISLGSVAVLVFILAQIEKNQYEYENIISMEVEIYEGDNDEVDSTVIAK